MTAPGPRSGAEGRRDWILSTLRAAGLLSVADPARQLGVAGMTIRRDLHSLQGPVVSGSPRWLAVRAGAALRHLRAHPWMRRVLWTGCGLATAQQATGINTVNHYAPWHAGVVAAPGASR